MKITKLKASKRLAIARDVLAQLKAARFIATSGTYVNLATLENGVTGELQKLLKKQLSKKNPCEVCGLGACFISAVRLFNQFKLTEDTTDSGGGVDEYEMRQKLLKFFTAIEMQWIECSFEKKSAFMESVQTDLNWTVSEARRTAFDGAQQYRDFLGDMGDHERLTWLMKAIAANANVEITFDRLRDAALREIAVNDDFAHMRRSLI